MEGLSEADICNMERLISGDDDANIYSFWDSPSLAQWFSSKGYTLYEREWENGRKVPYAKPRLSFDSYCEAVYPYAYHDLRVPEPGVDASLFARTRALVMYAQDAQLRHVAIKIAHVGSDEHKIWQFLNEQNVDMLRENCVLPILELLYSKSACFAIMPRWGDAIHEPRSLRTLRDALGLMRARLKGVFSCTLTTSSIACVVLKRQLLSIPRTRLSDALFKIQDLKPDNVVVNHFGDQVEDIKYYYTRRTQLQAGLLLYGLIDYNVSILLPGPVDRTKFRLPCEESYIGCPYYCNDTMQVLLLLLAPYQGHPFARAFSRQAGS